MENMSEITSNVIASKLNSHEPSNTSKCFDFSLCAFLLIYLNTNFDFGAGILYKLLAGRAKGVRSAYAAHNPFSFLI